MHSNLEWDGAGRLEELLGRLAEGNQPVDLRREAAVALAEAASRMPPEPSWIKPMHWLAVDEDPMIRRDIARALPHLPDEVYSPLAARLADDCNQYVRDAVAKAVERRGRRQRQGRKQRKDVADFQDRYRAFEATFGAKAARQARRMANEMFDVLVGGTLHDMDSILSPMRVDLDLMRRHLETGKPERASCRARMEKWRKKFEYLHAFLTDLRTYARAKEGQRSRVCVQEMIQRALMTARDGLQAMGLDTEAVAVDVEASETLRASLYPRQATTALMHLIRNGLETLAEATVAGKKRLAIRARDDGNNGLLISVEDNGPGIDPKTLQELLAFAPGKTTRKSHGTGFGLPTAHRFAEAHGGRLKIDSQPGTGAVFTLVLPATEEETAV